MNREQLKAILWLRWRLTRNQFARGGQINAALSLILIALLVAGTFGSAVAGFLAGLSPLAKQPPQVFLFLWDAVVFVFLMFWVSGLMIEIQRSESIDLARLLHLPITLRQVFVFNYALSHLTPGVLLLVPGMVTLSLGLALRRSPLIVLLVPAVLAFVFMVTAWTYCLRGWLAALMVNKRRRRAIVLYVTVGFILLSQLPNIFVHTGVFRRGPSKTQAEQQTPPRQSGRQLPEEVVLAHAFVPLGWPGYAAMHLLESNPWPALGAAAAGVLIGLAGLRRASRMTLRFYQGAESGNAKPRVKKTDRPGNGRLLVERNLPLLAQDTCALTLATLRSFLRSPEIKMALVMPVVASAGLLTVQFTRPKSAPAEVLGAFAATIGAVMTVFIFSHTMSNHFGLDRNGFRALVLLPVRRDRVLLAKNLALFPFVGGVAFVLLFLLTLFLRLPWTTFLTGLIQVPTAYFLFCIGSNLLSIFAPYRLNPGTLQAKKAKGIVFIAALANFMATPVVLLPLAAPPLLQLAFIRLGWWPWFPFNLLSAALILVAVGWFYRLILPIEGRLLQRREQTILKEVTEEIE